MSGFKGKPHLTAEEIRKVDHVKLIPQLVTMRRQGGSFAANLAQAWLNADYSNSRKLRKEFAELLAEYPPQEDILG